MKLTKAQRRYLAGISKDENMLRPASLGGEYGDLSVIGRLCEKGLVRETCFGCGYELTPAGRTVLNKETGT